MQAKTEGTTLKARQWVLVLILSLVAGAIGGLFAGGFTLIIDDDSHVYETPQLEGPP